MVMALEMEMEMEQEGRRKKTTKEKGSAAAIAAVAGRGGAKGKGKERNTNERPKVRNKRWETTKLGGYGSCETVRQRGHLKEPKGKQGRERNSLAAENDAAIQGRVPVAGCYDSDFV